ncbi:hypothetical protein [Pseudomonas mandelii]|uniref:hypothetical protein n=1 Tax=Pseudomonas mandelii TaxID=75612 RepID=UPI0012DE6788|nr:hypothetical protein [Pseudomonas mandelii]
MSNVSSTAPPVTFAPPVSTHPFGGFSRPWVTAIVLFGLEVEGDAPVYLEIRFEDYQALQIEGDHLMLTLEETMKCAEAEYGIVPSDWRAMSQHEIDRIPFS